MIKRTDWVTKYKPKIIFNCVLRRSIMIRMHAILKNNRIQNYLISGPSGSGKSSLAQALINDLNAESLWSNAPTIEVFRKKITIFMTNHSLQQKVKIVVIDEFDKSTKAVQNEILKPMEDSVASCILIVNDKSKLSDEIISRTAELDFSIPESEKNHMLELYYIRAKEILALEKITFTEEILRKYVHQYYPMFRKVINELQNGVGINDELMPL